MAARRSSIVIRISLTLRDASDFLARNRISSIYLYVSSCVSRQFPRRVSTVSLILASQFLNRTLLRDVFHQQYRECCDRFGEAEAESALHRESG